jgi:TolB-like protein
VTESQGKTDAKPPPVDRLSQLWRKIYDRKMAQWSVAYVAVAYALQHGVVLTSEAFAWPDWVLRVSMLLLILGLPVMMTFAWYHGERSNRHFSTAEMTIVTLLLVIGSVVFYAFVQPRQDVAATAASPRATATRAGTMSLAVLPFVNLSPDKDQEFFSDGMTEEITTALAKVADLHVVARTSAFEFKGKNINIKTMGEQLGATHLIEGSVRKAGNRLRISAQLIKADDGTHLWAEDYDRELTDVFAIQEDIAQAIAGALKVPLGLEKGENLVSNRTSDLDSYQQYLAARSLVRARGNGLEQAVAILEAVVAHDPGYAPAWALLADAYRLAPYFTPVMRSDSLEESHRGLGEALDKAEPAARHALMLDPKNAAAYAKLAVIETTRGHWAAGEELYRKALAFDPNDADTLHIYSIDLAIEGRLKDALSMRERLRMLEPFVPIYNIFNAEILQINGQNSPAIAILETIPSAAAGGYYRNFALAKAYARAGRYREAADTVLLITGNLVSRKSVDDAVRLLRQAPTKVSAPDALPPLNNEMSFIYAHVGAPERVIEFPERTLGYAQNSTSFALWLPEYAPLRKSERFKAYARKAGLVDYWRAKGWPELCHPTTGDDFVCE